MLTPQGIREAIDNRLHAIDGSCNSTHLHHNDGVIRGLIWALTGQDPGTYMLEPLSKALTLADIYHTVEGDLVTWDEGRALNGEPHA